MSAFIGASAGPHIGQCQNFILFAGAGGRYCLAPVLALGGALATDRDICGACQLKTAAFVERVTAQHVEAIVSGAGRDDFVKRTREMIEDLDRWRARRAADRAPVEELFKIRRDIELRERILAAVLAA
jgi:hypothetical protein